MLDTDKFLAYLRERDEESKRQHELLLQLINNIKDAKTNSDPSLVVNCSQNVEDGKSTVFLLPPDEYIDKKISPFIFSPKEGLTFDKWYDRAHTEFVSGRGKMLTDSDKAAIIRNKLSQAEYNCFAQIVLPKKPEELSLEETVKVLSTLFGRQESIFALRHKIMQVQMTDGEDFNTFGARVNLAAEEFMLSTFTLDDLKTQLFTQGLKSPKVAAVRKKIMEYIEDKLIKRQAENPPTTPVPTLHELISVANRMFRREEESKQVEYQPEIKQEVYAIRRKPCTLKCHFCGDIHWHVDCPFKEVVCSTCKLIGHKTGFCTSAKNFKERNLNKRPFKTQAKVNSGTIHSTNTHKRAFRKWVRPKINGVRVSLKHDSGSDWLIISRQNWERLGSPKLSHPKTHAVSASGDSVEVIGLFSATVEINNNFGIVDCYVSSQGLNLFGNSALEALQLWDQPISAYCDAVSLDQQELSEEVRLKFPALFSQTLGKCKLFKASIKLKHGSKPPFIRSRPVAFGVREALDAAYDQLVQQGVFTPINYASAAAPVVVVKKKDGSIRVTADYSTGLNRAIESFNYPLPTPESIFTTLAGNDLFTTLDLSSAFHQIELDDYAKNLMAVNTHRGLFQVNRLQFGVKTAPAQFQQLMDTILAGTGASAYLDDVIIPGKGKDDHKRRLMEVLKRLEDADLRLRLDKCKFGQTSIRFLGKIIDASGLRPDPEKLQFIRDLPLPDDVSQLRAFLGAINWYGNFIPNLKNLRGPLDDMLKKDTRFEWNDDRIKAFKRLKQALHSDLALTHYDPSKPLVVAADASSYGIGAALMHRCDDGSLKPIQYAATTFNDAERRYAQVEREALALVYAVKKFHRYIYGRHFELHTDHKPLLKIFGSKSGIPVHSANRLLRYANTLLGYDFEVKYIDNASFAYADFVSRLINTHARPGAEDIIIAEIRFQEGTGTHMSPEISITNTIPLNLSDLKRATEECEHLKKVRCYVETHWPSNKKQINDMQAAEYFTHRSELQVIDNCLFLGNRPVIPPVFRQKVLQELHIGHPGASRMNALARDRCFWPGMTQQITSYVQRCQNCAINAKAPIKEQLHPWPIPDKPWERIHIDYAGPIGHDYFFVIVDAHSNWPEVVRMRSTTAEQTCKALAEIFSRWGVCRTIVSDNGPQFISGVFKEFCANNGIVHITSAPYHPQSNGRAEKFVDTLKRGLKKMEGEGDTDQKLNTFLASYRGTPCSARSGKSPFELMTGRKMPSSFDLLQKDMKSTQNADKQMMDQFNRHHGAKAHNYHVNDPIYCQVHRGNTWTWQAGIILEQLGAANYLVHIDDRVIKAHANQLKLRFVHNMPTIIIPDDSSLPSIPQQDGLTTLGLTNYDSALPIANTEDQEDIAHPIQDSDTSLSSENFEDAEEQLLDFNPNSSQEAEHTPNSSMQYSAQDRPRRINAGVLPSRFNDFLMDHVNT